MQHLLRLLIRVLASLEPDTAGRAGAFLGDIAFLLGIRRQVARDNIARCLGLRGQARARITRRSYRAMGATMLQLWSYGARGPSSVDCTFASPTWIKHLSAAPNGYVMLTLHSGNWDVAGMAASQVFRGISVYATPQRNKAFDALLNQQRRALGMDVFLVRDGDRRGALQLIRGLRDGSRSVGMLADQGPRPSAGQAACFFGHPAWCHHGPVFMARRAGVPIIPAWVIRVGWNRYRFFAGRPLCLDGLSDAEAVQCCMDQIACMIRQAPGQYFWHHRRFKKAMEAMPPTGIVSRHDAGIALLNTPDGQLPAQ